MIRRVVNLLLAVAICSIVNAIQAQNAANPADTALRGSGRVNPSTLAMEIDINLGGYPGRGIDVPATLNYSSKVWDLDFPDEWVGPPSQDCVFAGEPKFADRSAAGWTTSLDRPYVEYIGRMTHYSAQGLPIKPILFCGTDPTEWRFVRRILVHLPGGATHELRADDTIYAEYDMNQIYNSSYWNATFYSVDGSNLRYVQNTATGTYRLQMPDGSFYDFAGGSTTDYAYANTYTDRNGNSTSFTAASGGLPAYWTDTLGRQIEMPFSWTEPSAPTVQTYALPGLGGTTPVEYKFHWKKLKDTTAETSALTDFNDSLAYRGNKFYSGTWQTRSPALFTSDSDQYTWGASLFNPVLLAKIELPTGEFYEFTYDVYGRIEQIRYPTGGREEFTYGSIDTLSLVHPNDNSAQGNFGVVERRVFETSTDITPYVWTYNTNHVAPAGYKVTVNNPDGTSVERFLHRGNDPCFNCDIGYFGYDNGLAGMEYETRSYDSGGSIVSRVLTNWEVTDLGNTQYDAHWHPRVTYQESITYDPAANGSAVSSIVKNEYQGNLSNRDTSLLLSKTTQYAFAGLTSAPMPSPGATPSASPTPVPTPSPSTAPVKIAEYLHLINDANYSGVKSNYTAQNMIGLVTESVIKDGAGNVVSKVINVFDESGRSPGYRGNPTTMKVWDSTKGAHTSSGAYIATSARFDTYGNRYEATDGRGCTNTTTFDSTYHAFPIQVQTCTPSDGTYGSNSGFTTTATFDPTTGLPLTTTDANGLETRIAYDTATLRPLNVKKFHSNVQVGSTAETEYNDEPGNYWVKNRTQIDTDVWAESITHFDGLGRAWKSEEINSNGNIFVEKEFDADGRVLRVSNPFRTGETKVWTTNSYDEAGRLVEVELQDGSTIATDYGVSASAPVGITKQITDQAGKKRKGVTDVLGRMVRVIEDPSAQNLLTDYVFDTLGNLRKTTQGVQNRFFMHDSLGRLLYAKQPEQDTNTSFLATDPITGNTAWSAKYEYDDNGNITRTTDARGISIEGAYDSFNRLKFRDYSDPGTPDVSFYYDGYGIGSVPSFANGKTTRVSSPVSETYYTSFDNLGRLLAHQQVTDGQTYPTAYEYNLSGGLVKETYPSGREIHHEIDEDGDLSHVWGDRAGASSTYANAFNYDANGAVTAMRLGNGRWETMQYNSRQQITQIGLGLGPNTQDLLKLNYGYGDNTQNNGSLREQKINYSGLASEIKQTYTYDALNRLASATEVHATSTQSWKETFLYDRYGNRTFDTTNNLTTTLDPLVSWAVTNPLIETSNNRLKEDQDDAGGLEYDHDAAGNVTLDAEGQRFVFDSENRQTQFFAQGNQTTTPNATYHYDGDGRRVKKISSLETSVFVYNASGTLVAEYSTALNPTPRTSYLTTDHLGSPRVITDQTGEVVSRHDYTAFGKDIAELLGATTGGRTSGQGYGATDEVRKRYTGYERDEESGLEFAQARYYNADQGRFTSPDPLTASASIRDPQSFNRYSYVLNSPYKFTDPLGLLPLGQRSCGIWCTGDGAGFSGGMDVAGNGSWHSGHINGWEQVALMKQQRAAPPQTMDPDTICDPFFEEREAARTAQHPTPEMVKVTPVFRLNRFGELQSNNEPGETPTYVGEAAYFEFYLNEDAPPYPALKDYLIAVSYFGDDGILRDMKPGPGSTGTFELPPMDLEVGFASSDALPFERQNNIDPIWQRGIVFAGIGGQIYEFHYIAYAWRENGINKAEIFHDPSRGVSGQITIPRPRPRPKP